MKQQTRTNTKKKKKKKKKNNNNKKNKKKNKKKKREAVNAKWAFVDNKDMVKIILGLVRTKTVVVSIMLLRRLSDTALKRWRLNWHLKWIHYPLSGNVFIWTYPVFHFQVYTVNNSHGLQNIFAMYNKWTRMGKII